MDISVVIVSWNVREHLKTALKSIKEHTEGLEYEVIVVDNASHDGSAQMVEEEFPWVKLIASNTNLGFGKANNRGAELATGDVIFILNDDVVFTENSLKKVHEKVMNEKDIGVLGYHLTNPDGSHQDSVRRYPKLLDQLIILTKLHNFFPNLAPVKRYLAQDIDYTQEQDVEQLMGACMIMRREVYEKASGFDERFFVWFEEVDLEKRIKEEQGLRVVYSPLTEMIHVKGASFGQVMSVKLQRMFNKSMRQYFWKHEGVLKTLLISAAQPVSIVLSFIVHAMKKRGVQVKKMKHGQN